MKNIYFLFGNDSDQISSFINDLSVEKSSISYDLNLLGDLSVMYDNESTLQLFNPDKTLKLFLTLKLFKSLEKDHSELVSFLEKTSQLRTIIIVLSSEKMDKKQPINSSLFDELKKISNCHEFTRLRYWQKDQITSRILELVKKYNLQFQKDALELFVEILKDNVHLAEQELKSIQIYLMPENIITKDTLNKFYDLSVNIDDLCNYLINNKQLNLVAINEKLHDLGAPLYLIAALQGKLRTMLQIKSYVESGMQISQIAKTLGMHPYRLEKELFNVKKITIEYLKDLISYLSKLEFNLKTGFIREENISDMLALLPVSSSK